MLINPNAYTFEELEIGQTETIEIQLLLSDIESFCILTSDYHPLHSSKRYAIKNGYDDIIAHGLLISSFSSALIGMKLPGENALITSQSFKYRHPTYPGDRLLISGKIVFKETTFNTIEVKVKIHNQASKLVASGLYKIKLRD